MIVHIAQGNPCCKVTRRLYDVQGCADDGAYEEDAVLPKQPGGKAV